MKLRRLAVVDSYHNNTGRVTYIRPIISTLILTRGVIVGFPFFEKAYAL
jgi:hypothetical protein